MTLVSCGKMSLLCQPYRIWRKYRLSTFLSSFLLDLPLAAQGRLTWILSLESTCQRWVHVLLSSPDPPHELLSDFYHAFVSSLFQTQYVLCIGGPQDSPRIWWFTKEDSHDLHIVIHTAMIYFSKSHMGQNPGETRFKLPGDSCHWSHIESA